MDMDFIPVCEERYDLCILPDLLDEEKLDILLKPFLQKSLNKA